VTYDSEIMPTIFYSKDLSCKEKKKIPLTQVMAF